MDGNGSVSSATDGAAILSGLITDSSASEVLSSAQIMYHFSIEFLELAVSCLGLGEGGYDCTALGIY